MKRAALVSLWVCLTPLGGMAQLGRLATLAAGSPADRAFAAIENEADNAKKIEMLEKFAQQFLGEARLLGYRRLQAGYLQRGELDKSILIGLAALRLDPSDFASWTNLARAFVQKQDVAQAFHYGTQAASLIERLKAMGPPEGTAPNLWENHKANLLDQHQADYQYLEYTLFQLASQQPDAVAQGELFERYIEAFPNSASTVAAFQACFAAYGRAGNADKILEVGESALAAKPDNLLVNLLLADSLSEVGKHLERAEALALRLPELADKAVRPENQTEEQWTQQKNTWKGLADSIQGQVLMHRDKVAEAAAKFTEAEPLLAAAPVVARARNLFRLGFAYARLGRLDPARRYLTQVVVMESPYKGMAEEVLKKVEEARAKRPK